MNKIDLKSINKNKNQSVFSRVKKLTKRQKGQTRDSKGKFTSNSGGLRQLNFNWKRALPVVVVVALTGGFLVYRSFAASVLLNLPGSEEHKADCTAARGAVVRETDTEQKRNAHVCQLDTDKTFSPVRFGGKGASSSNLSQYLAETAKLTGGQRNMKVCYMIRAVGSQTTTVTMGGYAPGGSPSGGHAHPLTNSDYQTVCDPALYSSNTRIFLKVARGTVRISSVSLQNTSDSAPITVNCRGPRIPDIVHDLCLNPSTIPDPNTGVSDARATTVTGWSPQACDRSRGSGGCGNIVAAFRTNCKLSHVSRNDPIVYPNQKDAAHWHAFFGNTAADENMSDPMVRGNSTCDGGILNRTAYWAPALIDTASYNAQTKRFNMVPLMSASDKRADTGGSVGGDGLMVYYKAGSGYDSVRARDIQWYPKGLRMIAGGNPSTAPTGPIRGRTQNNHTHKPVKFACTSWNQTASFYPTGDYNRSWDDPRSIHSRDEIPADCPPGWYIQAEIEFPQCGARNSNGTPVLDSPDHRSHMAYPLHYEWPDIDKTKQPNRICPDSHPIVYPVITEFFRWRVPSTGAAGLRFSSDMFESQGAKPGWTFHADWWNGWDERTSKTLLDNCFHGGIGEGMDCQTNMLGSRQSNGAWDILSYHNY